MSKSPHTSTNELSVDLSHEKLDEVYLHDEKEPLITNNQHNRQASHSSKTGGSGASPLDGFFKRVESVQGDANSFLSLCHIVRENRKMEFEKGRLGNKSSLNFDNLIRQCLAVRSSIIDLIEYCNANQVEYGDHQIRKIQIDALIKKLQQIIKQQLEYENEFFKLYKERSIEALVQANPAIDKVELETAIMNGDAAFLSLATINPSLSPPLPDADEISVHSSNEGQAEIEHKHLEFQTLEGQIQELERRLQEMDEMPTLKEWLGHEGDLEKMDHRNEEQSRSLSPSLDAENGGVVRTKSNKRIYKVLLLISTLIFILILIAVLVVYIVVIRKGEL